MLTLLLILSLLPTDVECVGASFLVGDDARSMRVSVIACPEPPVAFGAVAGCGPNDAIDVEAFLLEVERFGIDMLADCGVVVDCLDVRLAGDVDGDADIDLHDYGAMQQCWGRGEWGAPHHWTWVAATAECVP